MDGTEVYALTESTMCWELGILGFPKFLAGLPGQITSLLCGLPRLLFTRGKEDGGAFSPHPVVNYP